jgi:hypothetical protein
LSQQKVLIFWVKRFNKNIKQKILINICPKDYDFHTYTQGLQDKKSTKKIKNDNFQGKNLGKILRGVQFSDIPGGCTPPIPPLANPAYTHENIRSED